MSILIKGMKMPESCLNCPLETDYGTCGHFNGADYAKYSTEYSSRPVWCPLVELQPHGRLIDADEMVASVKQQTEIMREIAKEVDKLKPIANSKELDDVDIVAIAETVEKGVLQEIANAPTILEAEGGE